MPIPTQQELARYSRNRVFLMKASLMAVGGSVLLAFIVSLIWSPNKITLQKTTPSGIQAREDESLISLIRFGLPVDAESRDLSCVHLIKDGKNNPFAGEIETALSNPVTSPSIELISIWWKGFQEGNKVEAIAQLEAARADARYRNEFMADLHTRAPNPDTKAALRHYLAEAALFEDADYPRRCALVLANFEEDRPLVRKLLDDPSFRGAFEPAALLGYHASSGDYPGLFRSVLLAEWRLLFSPYVVPALFTAAIWFFILLAFHERSQKSVMRALAAFFLGIFSATLTLCAALIQGHLLQSDFNAEDTMVSQFVYLLAGVSLREEFLKLLCFLPMAIRLRRKSTPIEVLVLGGMVGIGFAFQENLIYFESGSGTFTAWLRLLTANALHFSLTGVAGFYLWRMLERPLRGWEEFLVSFLGVVFAHALYNALLAMPVMASYAPLSPILVAVIAYQYFDPLRQHMELNGMHRRFSPLGIFVLGSVMLTCAILITSSATQPFRFALGAFASSVGAMIPLAFAFISRFRDL